MVTHLHQWAQKWLYTEQRTGLLPGASTSESPRTQTVFLCNRQNPPTIKKTQPWTDIAQPNWILNTWSWFWQSAAIKVPMLKYYKIVFYLFCCLLCFLSPLPVITDNMQVSVHPVFFISAGTASSLSIYLNLLFGCAPFCGIETPLLCSALMSMYMITFKCLHFFIRFDTARFAFLDNKHADSLFYFHSMQLKHSDN